MICLRICCKKRVIELMKSIKDLWYEPYRDEDKECCVSFGSEKGVIVYWFCGLPREIRKIIEEADRLSPPA